MLFPEDGCFPEQSEKISITDAWFSGLSREYQHLESSGDYGRTLSGHILSEVCRRKEDFIVIPVDGDGSNPQRYAEGCMLRAPHEDRKIISSSDVRING